MSVAFDRIKRGLQEAIAHAEGRGQGVLVQLEDVKRGLADIEARRTEDAARP